MNNKLNVIKVANVPYHMNVFSSEDEAKASDKKCSNESGSNEDEGSQRINGDGTNEKRRDKDDDIHDSREDALHVAKNTESKSAFNSKLAHRDNFLFIMMNDLPPRPFNPFLSLEKIRYESIKAEKKDLKIKQKFSFPTYLAQRQNRDYYGEGKIKGRAKSELNREKCTNTKERCANCNERCVNNNERCANCNQTSHKVARSTFKENANNKNKRSLGHTKSSKSAKAILKCSKANKSEELKSSHLVPLKVQHYFKQTPFTIFLTDINTKGAQEDLNTECGTNQRSSIASDNDSSSCLSGSGDSSRLNKTDPVSRSNDKLTVMLKNIPNKYTSSMLISLLNEHHYACYDFLYLRMDFLNECNVGYAFINFTEPAFLFSFYAKVHGKGWKLFSSNKVAEVTYASIQGIEALYRKFQFSPILNEVESFRPKMFYRDGPFKGIEKKEFVL